MPKSILTKIVLSVLTSCLFPFVCSAQGDPEYEFGNITTDQLDSETWHLHTFVNPFSVAPAVIMGPLTYVDQAPATIRVRNITASGFEYQIDEWDYLDGVHGQESITYLAMEHGVHSIGGQTWEVQTITNARYRNRTVSLAGSFTEAPMVLTQIVSANNIQAGQDTVALAPRVTRRLIDSVRVRFRPEESFPSPRDNTVNESLSFIAISKGTGTLGIAPFLTAETPRAVRHTPYNINLGAAYPEPIILAGMQSQYGGDPSTLRVTQSTNSDFTVFVEEEQSQNSEVGHTTEIVGYLVIAASSDLDGDGMPNDWEVANGLNPNDPSDASADNDGDGVSNLDEYLNGTDPNAAPAAILGASVVEADGSEKEGLRVQFRIQRDQGAGQEAVTARFTVGTRTDLNLNLGSSTSADYVIEDLTGNPLTDSIAIPENQPHADVFLRPVLDPIVEVPEIVTFTLNPDATYTLASNATAEGLISDATDTSENETFYYGRYLPSNGAMTTASGLATMFVNGSNTVARISSTFSGLTSNQTAAHVHRANPTDPDNLIGPVIEGLPLGQVLDHPWNIRATAGFTAQQVLDSLTQADGLFLYVNVHSANYPVGEIRAVFRKADGTANFEPPADPPALPTLTGDALRRDAARFLTQATFGPQPGEIDALVDRINNQYAGDRIAAYNAWIDEQLAFDQTNLYDYTYAADQQIWALGGSNPITPTSPQPYRDNRRHAWWMLSTKAHDQLRQRLGTALSEIFVVSELNQVVRERHYGAAKYCDMLASNADGNFRTLLEDVSKHPIMGKYLSHLKNRKEIVDPMTGELILSPDENYAREILQIFCLGLLQLNPDGSIQFDLNGRPVISYDENDVAGLAKVFTGWSFSKKHGTQAAGYPVLDNDNFNTGNGPIYFQANWENPMINFAAYHDTGSKSYLGITAPANLDGEQDLDLALDTIFAHPNIGPFFCRLLIQRLVTSNPSKAYVYRVVQAFADNGSGVRGDMKAVTKAILLDYEARSLNVAAQIGFGKVKEPLLTVVQLFRAFGGHSDLSLSDLSSHGYSASQLDNFPVGTTRYRVYTIPKEFGQNHLRAPSVFNWFSPDYAPSGSLSTLGLAAPELEIATETAVMYRVNFLRYFSDFESGRSVIALPNQSPNTADDIKLDFTPLVTLYDNRIAAGDTKEQASLVLMDAIDDLIMAGNFRARYPDNTSPTNPRGSVYATVSGIAVSTIRRVHMAIYLMTSIPEYLTQK